MASKSLCTSKVCLRFDQCARHESIKLLKPNKEYQSYTCFSDHPGWTQNRCNFYLRIDDVIRERVEFDSGC